MSILDLIKKGESKTTEFKETLPSGDTIAKTVIAFSNTAGGKLIIGVDNNRQIVGIPDSSVFELQDKIVSIIYDRCYPNILPEIYTITVENKILLVIEVFRGSLIPYYLKNKGKIDGTYIRIGATNRLANRENILDLERQRNFISFDEEVNYNVQFTELDIKPVYDAFHKINREIDINKLINLKLVKQEKNRLYATNGLMIVLGLYDHCSVKCARFKGSERRSFLDKKVFHKDIFSVLEDTVSFIHNHLYLKADIKGLYRVETYEIPTEALREAIINALIHRDYTNFGRDIKVSIYDDMVDIVSPGCFPNGITMEDIFEGRSEIRNIVIANLFQEIGLIEKWGTGINRILSLCKQHQLPEPKIQEINDFISVKFTRPNRNDVMTGEDYEGVNEGANEGVNGLFILIKQYPNKKAQYYAEKMKTSVKNVERWIKKLRMKDKIEFRGAPKTGGYFAKREN